MLSWPYFIRNSVFLYEPSFDHTQVHVGMLRCFQSIGWQFFFFTGSPLNWVATTCSWRPSPQTLEEPPKIQSGFCYHFEVKSMKQILKKIPWFPKAHTMEPVRARLPCGSWIRSELGSLIFMIQYTAESDFNHLQYLDSIDWCVYIYK
jgi:hypothetical protein